METQEKDKTDRCDESVGETERLTGEIARLNEKLRHKDDVYLRALADFENYRKRIEREQTRAAQKGKRDLVLALLETLDGFDRMLEQTGGDPVSLAQGVRAIYRQLMNQLEAQGVTPFKSQGEPFDPKLHEAVDSVAGGQYEPGTIADELQRGYRWGDEVLRPARVRVAR